MKKHMKKKELEVLLEHNKQEIPVGEVEKLPKPYREKNCKKYCNSNPFLNPNFRTACWIVCVTISLLEPLSPVQSATVASWSTKVVRPSPIQTHSIVKNVLSCCYPA